MGIYIQGYGTFSGSEPKDIADRLIDSARRWATERGVQELFYAAPLDAGAWISIYPPAGGIAFEPESGRIAFGTKTSVAGPGYHAALVDLCDWLESDLGVRWHWGSGGDDTNYAVERDLDKLCDAFLDQIIGYSEFHRDNVEPGELHALNLSEGLAMDGYEGVATPLGPVPAQLLPNVPDSLDETEALARRIFPWWSPTFDQEFWINSLRALMWTEVEWRAARTPWESHVHKAALELGMRLRPSLDADLSQAVDELAAISPDKETFVAPSPMGIGYLRRRRGFFLPGPWRINLPGYYIEQAEDDGTTTCLWFGNEEIRGSSFTITPKDSGEEVWSEKLVNEPTHEANGCIFRLQPAAKHSISCDGFFDAFAEVQTRSKDGNIQLLILSLFDTHENLIPRLAEITQRVWFDEPSSGSGGVGQ
ncbi:MAG TPA: hypothetical protein VIT38_05170 [Allosphingosinicella sp.]